MPKSTSHALSRFARILTPFLLAICCLQARGEDIRSLESLFDQLSASLNELTDKTAAITEDIESSNGYLNTLVSEPFSVAKQDLSSAFSTAQEMTYDEWMEMTERNKDEMVSLLQSDPQVQAAIADIESRLGLVSERVDELKPTLDRLRVDASRLGIGLKEYIGKNPLRMARFGLFATKVADLGRDLSKMGQTLQNSLTGSNAALQKLGNINSLASTSGVATSPQAPGPSAYSPPSTASTFAPTGNAATGMTASSTTSPASGLEGFWRESNSSSSGLMLLLGPPEINQPSGYVVLPNQGGQTFLTLREVDGSSRTYAESREGHFYKTSLFDGQLVLKSYKSDGTTLFQIFMSRP